MIADFDSFTMWFVKSIAQYCILTSIFIYQIQIVTTESIIIIHFHQGQHCKNYFGNITAKSTTNVSHNYQNKINLTRKGNKCRSRY